MLRTVRATFLLLILAATFTSSVHGRSTYSRRHGHHYPRSSGGSGDGPHLTAHPGTGRTTNDVYYVYRTPQQIHYTPVHGAVPVQPYPIYQHTPPTYVNTFSDSGSKYSTLLTGLALYNLGRSGSHHSHHENGKVSPDNGEECSLRIEDGRDVDIVKIPCYIVTTFNAVADQKMSVTTMHAPAPLASSVQNSTSFTNAMTVAQNATAVRDSSTVQNNATKLVDAETLKGEPVKLSDGAKCFVQRRSKMIYTIHEIECGLLQQYAIQSMQRNFATHHNLSFSALFIVTITAHALC